jgi:hypothetical protein
LLFFPKDPSSTSRAIYDLLAMELLEPMNVAAFGNSSTAPFIYFDGLLAMVPCTA